MTVNKAYLAKIHIAKKELGLDDDSYRDIMARICAGKTSAKELTIKEADAVIDEFKRLGWKPKRKGSFKKADDPQVRLIYALWGLLKKKGAVQAQTPHAFCEVILDKQGYYSASRVEWIKERESINHIVEVLKQKCYQNGIELED